VAAEKGIAELSKLTTGAAAPLKQVTGIEHNAVE
jgi:hypothetical protein